MKRRITLITVVFLITLSSVSFAEPETIDLDTMTLEEIATLISRAQLAMLQTDDWQGVNVPAGIQVRVDIPSGKWNI